MRQIGGRQHLAQLLLLLQDLLAQLLLLALIVLNLAERRLQRTRFRANRLGQLLQFMHNGRSGFGDLRVAADAIAEMHLHDRQTKGTQFRNAQSAKKEERDHDDIFCTNGAKKSGHTTKTHLQLLHRHADLRLLDGRIGQVFLQQTVLIAQWLLLVRHRLQQSGRLINPGAYVLQLAFALFPLFGGLLQEGELHSGEMCHL